jgi:hypothetical protein
MLFVVMVIQSLFFSIFNDVYISCFLLLFVLIKNGTVTKTIYRHHTVRLECNLSHIYIFTTS